MIQNIPGTNMVVGSPSQVAGKDKTGGAIQLSKQFSDSLGNAISQLNQQQAQVNQLNEQFVAGNQNNVHQLMIATEKSMLGLDLVIQVRDKVVSAYQEIMRMQI